MRRRAFITLIAGATVTRPFAALAQEPGRAYRLGLLWPAASQADPLVAFLDEVGRHGFIVGKNLTVDFRAFALHPDRLSEYAAELVKGQVDAISTAGNMALRVAQEATKTIPILAITDDRCLSVDQVVSSSTFLFSPKIELARAIQYGPM